MLDIKFQYSPSHEKSLKDLMLSHGVMDVCLKSVLRNPESDPVGDCFLSPQHLSNEILERFPPTRLMLGENDPIRDHGMRFLQRLV